MTPTLGPPRRGGGPGAGRHTGPERKRATDYNAVINLQPPSCMLPSSDQGRALSHRCTRSRLLAGGCQKISRWEDHLVLEAFNKQIAEQE